MRAIQAKWMVLVSALAAGSASAAPRLQLKPSRVAQRRAQALAAAMVDEETDGTFGGRLPTEHDVDERLVAHYPRTLSAARELATVPKLRDFTGEALRGVSMPEDQRWRLERLVKAPVTVDAEDLARVLSQAEPSDLDKPLEKPTDPNAVKSFEAVKSFCAGGKLDVAAVKGLETGNALRAARLLARWGEAHSPTSSLTPEEVNAINLPLTDEAARVLLRIAKVYRLDPRELRFGQGTVFTHFAYGRVPIPELAGYVKVEAEAAGPLGPFPDGHREPWQLEDEELKDPGKVNALRDLSVLVKAPSRQRLGFLRAWARAQEIGAILPQAGSPINVAVLNNTDWPQTLEGAQVLARVAHAYGIDERELRLGNNPWGVRYFPAEELGTAGLYPDEDELRRLLETNSPTLFELDDQSLREAALRSGSLWALINHVFDGLGGPPSEDQLLTALSAWRRSGESFDLAVSPAPAAGSGSGGMGGSGGSGRGGGSGRAMVAGTGGTGGSAGGSGAGAPSIARNLRIQHFSERYIHGFLATPAVLRELLKLAHDAGLPLNLLKASLSKHGPPPPGLDSLAAAVERELTGGTAPLPKRPAPDLNHLAEALRGLPHRGALSLEYLASVDVGQVVRQAVRSAQRGTLQRIDFARLNAEDRERVVEALTRDGHLGVAAVLAGLFVDGGLAPLSKALRELGYTGEQVGEWLGHAQALRQLSGPQLAMALREFEPGHAGDLALFPLRVRLAQRRNVQVTPDPRHYEVDGVGVLQALIDRADLPTAPPEARAEVEGVLRGLTDSGLLTDRLLQQVLSSGRYGTLYPNARADLEGAVERLVQASPEARPAEVAHLVETIQRLSQDVDTGDLVRGALSALYAADLKEAPPLGRVPADSNHPAGHSDGPDAESESSEVAMLAGIPTLKSQNPDRDRHMIPRVSQLGLVETDTFKRNLKRVAIEIAAHRPVMLIGGTGLGKTTMVEYAAGRRDKPFFRFSCSKATEIEDLIGDYVIQGARLQLKDLRKMKVAQLREVARTFQGVDPDLDRGRLINRIFEAQGEPVWRDGPLTLALRGGWDFVFDEIDLLRPTVLTKVNSVLDHRRALRLTQHTGEIVKAHPEFQPFATGNGSGYVGRGKLSRDALSRWTRIYQEAYQAEDYKQILAAKLGGQLDEHHANKLVAVHMALVEAAATGKVGGSLGGLAYSPRDLESVARRFLRYRRQSSLSDDQLLRREVDEVYAGGLWEPEELEAARDQFRIAGLVAPPAEGFYSNLKLTVTDKSFTVGDVTLRRLDTKHALVPSEAALLEESPRDLEVLYRLMKAIDLGEHPFLMGEAGTGKTAAVEMLSHFLGQPYYESIADAENLIGKEGLQGFEPGELYKAGHPDAVPGILVIDEITRANTSDVELLNSVHDKSRSFADPEHPGKVIKLHRDFRSIATSNPPTPRYPGSKPLSPAFYNRFRLIWVRDHTADETRTITRGRAAKKDIPEPVADALVDLHLWTKARYDDGTFGKESEPDDLPDMSTRHLVHASLQVLHTQAHPPPAIAEALRRDGQKGQKGHKGQQRPAVKAAAGPKYGEAFLNTVLSEYASTPIAQDNEAILDEAKRLRR